MIWLSQKKLPNSIFKNQIIQYYLVAFVGAFHGHGCDFESTSFSPSTIHTDNDKSSSDWTLWNLSGEKILSFGGCRIIFLSVTQVKFFFPFSEMPTLLKVRGSGR